jgi:vacuolar-type H+-ATPase subunit I/STV1
MKLTLFTLGAAFTANPVGQVLDLLTQLHDTVVADGEKEQKQYAEFAEWCDDQGKEKNYEIKTGKSQSADLKAQIEKANADIDALRAKIGDLSNSIATNNADLKAATDIRNKENGDFRKEEQELVDTIDTLSRAQSVLSKHMQSGSFAQIPQAFKDMASSLNVILNAAVFSTHDKSQLKAFLQSNQEGVNAPEAAAYESHSSGILDTLADMQVKAEGMLSESRKTEMNSKHSFELLAQSLNDEMSVQNEDMSNAKRQLGATGETKATAEGDLAATLQDLKEDQEYLSNTAQNCQQRAMDFEASQKSRAEELQALAEAKKVIGEATGGASGRQYRGFFQVKSKKETPYPEVVSAIKKLGRNEGSYVLTQLAGQIRAVVSMSADPFAKVKGLIAGMIDRLVREAQEEASHKAFCDKETAENEAKRNKLNATVNKLSTRIERDTAKIAKLKEEIAGLQAALASIAKKKKIWIPCAMPSAKNLLLARKTSSKE